MKPMKDYPGYLVSRDGQVFKESGEVVNTVRLTTGHLGVNLQVNGKRRSARVHLLVASAYVPNPHNHPHLEFIDGKKTNPAADNLRWISRAEYKKRHHDFAGMYWRK